MKEPYKLILIIIVGLSIGYGIGRYIEKPKPPIYMSIPDEQLILKKGDTISAGVENDRIDVLSNNKDRSGNLRVIIIK